ncbi:MAG: AAA family ATPase, partial [Nitrospirota bacterium]
MNTTLNTLRQWSDAGWLRRLDSALAAFVLELDPQAPPALLVATALLAHMEGRGHTCLPLAPLVRDRGALLGWPTDAQAALQDFWHTLPDGPQAWIAALQASPVVRQAGLQADAGQPLVLGGSPAAPLLYLRRYWSDETRVVQALVARTATPQPVEEALARQWLDRLFASDAAVPERGVDWQKVACAIALRSRLSVITGGPGTGKTYTAARLLALLAAVDPQPERLRVALAAP